MKFSVVTGNLAVAAGILLAAQPASAVDNCTFTKTTKSWTLTSSCQTDTTFVVPKNVTVNGQNPITFANFTVTAVDPVGGNFVGPVFRNTTGQPSYFKNLNIRTNVADTCVGDPNFAGILIEDGASTITNVNITINRNGGNSTCPEGIAILARKLPANTKSAYRNVKVTGSTLNSNQLAGFVGQGNVSVRLTSNLIRNLDGVPGVAQRGIELSQGAKGVLDFNEVLRNKVTPSNPADPAYGILLDRASKTSVLGNIVNRNDVAIRVTGGTSVSVKNNTIQDSIFDGILVDDENNVLTKTFTIWGNTVRKSQNGIHIKSVNGLIEKGVVKENITQQNREAGIILEGGVLNKVQSNISDSNSIVDIANVSGTNAYTKNVCVTSSGPPVDCP